MSFLWEGCGQVLQRSGGTKSSVNQSLGMSLCLLELAFWCSIQCSISPYIKYWLEMRGGSEWVSWAFYPLFPSFLQVYISWGDAAVQSVYCLGLVFLLCCETIRREGKVCLSLVTLVVESCSVTLWTCKGSATGVVSNRLMSNCLFFFTLSSCLEKLESSFVFRWLSKMEPTGRACCCLGSCLLEADENFIETLKLWV